MANWFHNRTVDELPVLLRYARALTRDAAAAEDLVHDALVHAYRAEGSFRSGGNLRGWLLAIVRNRFLSGARRDRAEAARVEQIAALAETNQEGGQEQSAELREVVSAFDELNEEQRAVLQLVVVEGLTYQAAAKALDVPVGTIMSRLSRARAALRQRLSRQDGPARHLRIVG